MREWLLGDGLCLGLSHEACTLVVARSGKLLAEAALDGTPERTRLACKQVLGARPRGRSTLSVVLSGDWTRLWRVVPPAGSARLSDLQAATTMRFQNLYGERTEDWTVRADYQSDTPFLASAMPSWLYAVLVSEAKVQGLALVRIAPQFLLAWNLYCSTLTPECWLGLIHDGVLTLGVMSQGQLETVFTTRLPVMPDGSWLSQVVQRESLRLGRPAPRQLLLHDAQGQVPEPTAADHLRWHSVGRAARQRSPGICLALSGSAA